MYNMLLAIKDKLLTVLAMNLSVKIKRVLVVGLLVVNARDNQHLTQTETEVLFNRVTTQLSLGYSSSSLRFITWMVHYFKLDTTYISKGEVRINALKRKCLLAYNPSLMDHDFQLTKTILSK